MKKIKLSLITIFAMLGVIIIIAMGVLGTSYMRKAAKHSSRLYSFNMRPVIFVPGSESTQERFNGTFRALDQISDNHSILKVTVDKKCVLHYTGNIKSKDKRPYIVIAFEENTDSYETIKKQATWLDTALNELQKRYHFRSFSAVAHSNGGLDLTVWLENYWDSDNFYVERLLTIGTPYNLEVTNPNNRTEMLKDLITDKQYLPKNLVVFNLGGGDDYDDDSIVPSTSVLAGKYIFQKQVKSYTQITVSGDDSDHSDLPQNKQVIRYINQAIIKDNHRPDKEAK